MHSCGHTAIEGLSWPNFLANFASFTLSDLVPVAVRQRERARRPRALLAAERPHPGERALSGSGIRLAQKMQVGPCIPVGIQL
jgi:hypothetical protein